MRVAMCHYRHGQEDQPDEEHDGDVPDVDQACSLPYEETAYLAGNLGVRGGGDHADGGEKQCKEDGFRSNDNPYEAAVAVSGDRREEVSPVKYVVQRTRSGFDGHNGYGCPDEGCKHAADEHRYNSSILAKLCRPVPDRQPSAGDT